MAASGSGGPGAPDGTNAGVPGDGASEAETMDGSRSKNDFVDIRFPVDNLPQDSKEYKDWRFGVQATFFSLCPDVDMSEKYWDDLEKYQSDQSDDMFQDSLDMIKECKLTHLHIFPYSIRKNTPAARMPQIPKDIIKKRAKILREEGNRQMQIYLENQIGNSTTMLVEQVKENISYGKSQHFTKIKIQETIKEGAIVKCIITDVNQGILNARII